MESERYAVRRGGDGNVPQVLSCVLGSPLFASFPSIMESDRCPVRRDGAIPYLELFPAFPNLLFLLTLKFLLRWVQSDIQLEEARSQRTSSFSLRSLASFSLVSRSSSLCLLSICDRVRMVFCWKRQRSQHTSNFSFRSLTSFSFCSRSNSFRLFSRCDGIRAVFCWKGGNHHIPRALPCVPSPPFLPSHV